MNQDQSVSSYPDRVRVHVEFVISGNSSPDAITEALGIRPDSVQRVGEPIARRPDGSPAAKARFNRWAVSSAHRTTSRELDHHLRILLDIVLPRREEISRLSLSDRLWFWIFWESDAMPRGTGMILSADVCRDVASLCAELDFDLYCSAH